MCTNREKKKKELKISVKTPENINIPTENSVVNTSSLYDTDNESSNGSDKLELYIYYESDKMPENGWMQSCFRCDSFTAATLIYREEYDRDYIVYICNSCKKRLTNSEENNKFRRRCDKFIKKNFESFDF